MDTLEATPAGHQVFSGHSCGAIVLEEDVGFEVETPRGQKWPDGQKESGKLSPEREQTIPAAQRSGEDSP